MKVTPETKLKDLIPEDMELDKIRDSFYKELGDARTQHLLRIDISLNSKQVKDFEWYVTEYFKRKTPFSHKVASFIDWDTIKLEVKIGVFIFIFNDISGNYKAFEIPLNEIRTHFTQMEIKLSKNANEIMSICPKEFLESIFE